MAFYQFPIDVLCLIYFLNFPELKKGHNVFDLMVTKAFLVKYIDELTNNL